MTHETTNQTMDDPEARRPPPANPTGSIAGYRAELYVDLDADSSLRYVVYLQHVGCETDCGHAGQGVGATLEQALMDARFAVNRDREAARTR